MIFKKSIHLLLVAAIGSIGGGWIGGAPLEALALPFNQDMSFGQDMPAGSIMRPRAPNTVPIGSLSWRIESREAALKLENPLRGDKDSTANGERLFAVNCSPCHGKYSTGPGEGQSYKRGAVANYVPGPDITDPIIAAKPDGHFYGYIHFGGMAIMPAYGWKLSPTEHWDIVNYVRKVQAARR
jgi:mono/diheme cytochrome c family protein